MLSGKAVFGLNQTGLEPMIYGTRDRNEISPFHRCGSSISSFAPNLKLLFQWDFIIIFLKEFQKYMYEFHYSFVVFLNFKLPFKTFSSICKLYTKKKVKHNPRPPLKSKDFGNFGALRAPKIFRGFKGN